MLSSTFDRVSDAVPSHHAVRLRLPRRTTRPGHLEAALDGDHASDVRRVAGAAVGEDLLAQGVQGAADLLDLGVGQVGVGPLARGVLEEGGHRSQCPGGGAPMHLRNASPRVECDAIRWVRSAMTEQSHHDQDADPPTPDGEEPDQEQLRPDSEPASDPDPDPGAGTTTTHSEEDA